MTNLPRITAAAIRAKVTESVLRPWRRLLPFRHRRKRYPARQPALRRGAGQRVGPLPGGRNLPRRRLHHVLHLPLRLGRLLQARRSHPADRHADNNGSVPIAVKPPVADLLASLDADELRTLVHLLVEAAPDLLDVVDAFCAEEPT